MRKLVSIAVLPLLLAACAPESSSSPAEPGEPGGPTRTDAQYREEAVQQMHDVLLTDVEAMRAAIVDLQAAAPTPADRGWDEALDADSLVAMRAAWVRARTAYEHVEGALAPLFPDIDNAIDARYDDFMTQLQAKGGDPDPFDGVGVTGMHAIERILYADVAPERVVAFEASLPGYTPAAFPGTAAEAAAFRKELCGQLLTDIGTLEAQWTPTNIHVAVAYQGLVLLVQEQREKVMKAASSEEESRYSQRTMADLRGNLAGAQEVYALFRPWLLTRVDGKHPARDGAAVDTRIQAGFAALAQAYAAVPGDAIPAPPATWSAESPSAIDLATPFGRLYTSVNAAVDPSVADSAAAQLEVAAGLLGLEAFGGGQ
jgi:iron uptake system component EfeO